MAPFELLVTQEGLYVRASQDTNGTNGCLLNGRLGH
jgi:hypothetical protein